MLLLLGILFIPKVLEALKNQDFESSAYYQANRATRISYAVHYLMLALCLSVTVFVIHEKMTAGIWR